MRVKFGVITDLHAEYIPDGFDRMEKFLHECLEQKVDFCIQLGDFCPPGEMNGEQKEKIMKIMHFVQ